MFRKILVPIDLANEASARSLPQAISQARASDGRIRLVNVVAPIPTSIEAYLPAGHGTKEIKVAEDGLKALIAQNNIADIADTAVRSGAIYDEVLTEAREMEADLIIVVSHHPTISDYLLGSNAASIVRHADCSVLVLRD